MRVYPERRLEVGKEMRNDCTCGHCRLAHVKRESNTARVYKMQLPPIKTKKAKPPPKKTVTPKSIYGYQLAPKKKLKPKKPVHKSVVQSKPEYDAWYFSNADLHTIAHSNMENYLSRFQPDMQEMGTQTSTPVMSPKLSNLTKAPSKEKAVQIRLSEKEVKNSFNNQHKGGGESPPQRNSPVALSVLMNSKASGDYSIKKAPETLRYNCNFTSKNEPKFKPSSEKLIAMPPGPQLKAVSSPKQPNFVLSEFDDQLKSLKTNSKESKRITAFDDFIKSPLSTKLLHSESKNRIKELLDLERHIQPRDVFNSEKQVHRLKHYKNRKRHKTDAKIPRKLLETSLKKEKEARKSLTIENDGLKSCISKAEQKVRDMRSSLAELSNTIRTYRAKSSLPYVTRVEKLEKLVDDLIREFRASSKTKAEVCCPPEKPSPKQKYVQANYAVVSTEPRRKDTKKKVSTPKKDFGNVFDESRLPASEEEIERFDWSNMSSISSIGVVSRSVTVSTATTSLTALKKELGKFFEDMREDTEKLIEEAEFHREALMSYSERTSSVASYDSTSTVST